MNSETLLLRQVHPSFVQDGEISSQVFMPWKKDDDKLSLYNGEKHKPCDALEHYTEELGFESMGVMGVTHGEVESLEIPVVEDNNPFDGHCSADFSSYVTNAQRKKAKRLKRFAQSRGWLCEQ